MKEFMLSPDSGHPVASDTSVSAFRKGVLQRFPQKANYSSRLRFTIDVKVKDEAGRLGEHEVPHHKMGLTLGRSCHNVLCDSQAEVHLRRPLMPGCPRKAFSGACCPVGSLACLPSLRCLPGTLLSLELPTGPSLPGVLLVLTEHLPHAALALPVPAQGSEHLSVLAKCARGLPGLAGTYLSSRSSMILCADIPRAFK